MVFFANCIYRDQKPRLHEQFYVATQIYVATFIYPCRLQKFNNFYVIIVIIINLYVTTVFAEKLAC